MQTTLFDIISVVFDGMCQLLTMFYIHYILEKQKEWGLAVYQLFVDFKKTIDSVESEVWVWYPYEQQ